MIMLNYIYNPKILIMHLTLVMLFACNVTAAQPNDPRFAITGDETEPPAGYYDFCMEHLNLCDNEDRKPVDISLTADKLRQLEIINTEVNDQIAQVSDTQHYGKTEYWALPMDGEGDCEDISILKRLRMIKAGFPIQSILLTHVIAPKAGSHIILTIKTDKGEYIADNLVDELVLWNQVPYKFVKRQSQYQQNVWVNILPTNTKLSLTNEERKQLSLTGSIRAKRHETLLEELKDKSAYRNPCGRVG